MLGDALGAEIWEDAVEGLEGEGHWQWNERFQQCVCMPEATPQQKLEKYTVLTNLNKDFITTATTYAQTIINEYFLPDEEKSVRVGRLGGIAGGVKFVWNGILFKLADGSRGPYRHHHTPDEAAAKAIGHDLKGAEQYYRCNIPGLHFALQAIIDYKGFRMHTQALLPISRDTLKVGTDDAGAFVKADDAALLEKLKLAARELNLAAHQVNGVELYSACDVEGHLGEDGRHYLVDFARTFPPESPRQCLHLAQPAVYRVGQKVLACLDDGSTMIEAYISRMMGDSTYEVLLGPESTPTTASRMQLKPLDCAVFWRMLRPEFVKNRGKNILRQRRTAKREHQCFTPPPPPPSQLSSLSAAVPNLDTLPGEMVGLGPSHFESGYLPANTLLGWTRQFSVTVDASGPSAPYTPLLKKEHSYEAFLAEEESGKQSGDEDELTPLSSDAFSNFSRDDPNRDALNADVDKATYRLVNEVIPALAEELADKGHPRSAGLTMVEFLHIHGVNVRHCGLVRSYLSAGNPALADVRSALLLEIVSRTIKNIVREALRSWMKQKRSTSEMAIRQLLAKYLCLTTGSHKLSKQFWDHRILPGVVSRFGSCSLTPLEQHDLQAVCQRDDQLLRNIVLSLCRMLGIVLTEQVRQQFSTQPACMFEFVTSDIHIIIPVVKHMHQVDLAEGIMLCQLAHQKNPHGELSFAPRVVELGVHHLKTAMKAVPDDMMTRHSLGDAYQMLGWLHAGTPQGDAFYEQARRLWNDDPNTHCSVLRLSFHEDIIGVLVNVEYPRHLQFKHKMARKGLTEDIRIPAFKATVSVDLHPISLRAHLDSYDSRKRFFPLIINEEHGRRALPLLHAQIRGIADIGTFPMLVDLAHPSVGVEQQVKLLGVESGAEPPEATAAEVLDVLSSTMNQLVVSFVTRIIENRTDVTEEALLGYMRFHHTLLFLAKRNPEIAKLADQHVARFIEDAKYRTKEYTPDLGNFMVYLLLSSRSWFDLNKVFLFELFDRGVNWFVDPGQPRARSELLKLETAAVDPYRLVTTFDCCTTSLRLVMFQVYFTNSIGRRAGYSWEQMLEMYNSSYGRPTAGMRDNMREQVQQILSVRRYDEFFYRVGVRFTPAEFTKVLRNAIRGAVQKGYVNCVSSHGELATQLGQLEELSSPIEEEAANTTWDQVYEEYEANSKELIERAQQIRLDLRSFLKQPKVRKLARSSTGSSDGSSVTTGGDERGERGRRAPGLRHAKSMDERSAGSNDMTSRDGRRREARKDTDERVWRKGEDAQAPPKMTEQKPRQKGNGRRNSEKQQQRRQQQQQRPQQQTAEPAQPAQIAEAAKPVALVTEGKSYSSAVKAQQQAAAGLRATAPEFVPKANR